MKPVFLFLFTLLCISFLAKAQTDTIEIQQVTISTKRAPVLYSESSRVVTVISKEQIAAAPVHDLQGLLEAALGVDVRQRGTQGVQADVSIRGGSFEQTLILLNGIKINDPQTGHHNLNLPIDLQSIERIEILQGPGSRVFGANALSGAINIITNQSRGNHLKMNISGGQHRYYRAALSTQFEAGKTQNFISASKKASDGFAPNTDFDIESLFFQHTSRFAFAKIEAQAGFSEKKFGANSFYSPQFPQQFEATRTRFASLKMTSGKRLKFSPVIYWRRHNDRFELFRTNPAAWYAGHNYHQTDIYGAELNTTLISAVGRSALGLEYRSENILSNKLGAPMNDTLPVPGESRGEFTHSKSRKNVSIFAEHSVFWQKTAFSAGALINWNSDFGWNTQAGIDFSYRFSPKIKLFASLNQSLRMPTFTDLYYQSPTNQGNTNLKPEEALTGEAGIKYTTQSLQFHAAVFARQGKNMIDWVKMPHEDIWRSQNLTEIQATGFEIAAKYNFARQKEKNFSVSLLEINYSYNSVDKNSGEYLSAYVLDYLKHQFNLSVAHKLYKNFGASWTLSAQDRAGSYAPYNPNSQRYEKQTPYKPFALVSGKIFWKKEFFTAYLSVSNLFNSDYTDIGNVEMPGRWAKMGVKVELSKPLNLRK